MEIMNQKEIFSNLRDKGVRPEHLVVKSFRDLYFSVECHMDGEENSLPIDYEYEVVNERDCIHWIEQYTK